MTIVPPALSQGWGSRTGSRMFENQAEVLLEFPGRWKMVRLGGWGKKAQETDQAQEPGSGEEPKLSRSSCKHF